MPDYGRLAGIGLLAGLTTDDAAKLSGISIQVAREIPDAAKLSGVAVQVALVGPLSYVYGRLSGLALLVAMVGPLNPGPPPDTGGPMADHLPNISISITLDAAPLESAGFSKVLGIFPLATNSLNGERVAEYASVTEAQTAQTAGYISASCLAAITAMFSQTPKPSSVLIGNIDLVGVETISAALAAIQAERDDFYGIFYHLRDDTSILALSAAVEATRKICCVQSDDSSWLNSGLPSGLTALAARERTIVVYHDEDTEWMDAAFLANRLVYDPDTVSVSWDAPVKGVAPYTTGLTAGERTAALANNCNLGLPYGAETFFIDSGVNCNGRAIYEVVSADWFYARIQENVAQAKVNASARGQKIPVSATGQIMIKAILDGLLQRGVDANHFEPGQVRSAALTITSTDLTNRRMRFQAWAQIRGSARLFDFLINFGRDPVFAEEA